MTVAGRLLRRRDYGGVLFAQLRDWSGEIQLLFDRASLDDGLDGFTAATDLGDLVEVSGTMGRSNTGVRSVLVRRWRLNGKCLRPLPDKWKGLTDQEARVRTRYVDLAVNPEARDLIRARSNVLRSIRETLFAKDFLEVETPILQQIHGGANARPFVTHINAYDLDLYLRIAPELYLKRLCVGGVERVFELGRAFRNEGVDFSHNPEFTLLEAYQAHADYRVWIDGCRELIQNAATAANGAQIVLRPGSPARWSRWTSPALGRSKRCTMRCRRPSASTSTSTPNWTRCVGCVTPPVSPTKTIGTQAPSSSRCTSIWSRPAPSTRRSTPTSPPRSRR